MHKLSLSLAEIKGNDHYGLIVEQLGSREHNLFNVLKKNPFNHK